MAHKTCFSWNPSVSFKKSYGFLIFLDESHQYRLSSINGMDVDSFNEALQNPHSDESEELQRVRLSLLKHRFLLDSEQVEMYKQHPNLAYFARYTDHPLLMQEKLVHATVVLLGCGGIGSVVAQALAAMGVGTIVLVDYDVVSASNLNRQFLYSPADIGKPKVVIAQQELSHKYPNVTIKTSQVYLSSYEKLENVFINFDADLVVCAIDHPVGVSKYVKKYCSSIGLPVISAGVGIKYGHVSLDVPFEEESISLEEKTKDWEDCSTATILAGSLATSNGMVALAVAHVAQLFLTNNEYLPSRVSATWLFNFEDLSSGLEM